MYLNERGTFETFRPGSLWRRIFGAIGKDGKNNPASNPDSNPVHPKQVPSRSTEEQEEADQSEVSAEYALAISYYEQALSLYQRFDVPDEIARTLNNLGRVYVTCQRKAEAQSTYLQALSLSQKTGERRIEAASLANLGLLCREQADLEHAQIYYKQALRIFHQFRNSWEEAELLRNLGTLFLLRQHYDVGLASFILARDIFHALECPEQGKIPAWVEAELRLALKQGNYEEWFQEIESNPIPLLERTLYSIVQ